MRNLGLLLIFCAASAASPVQEGFAEWVDSHGGRVERGADGAIIALDLSNTWIGDADMGRIADLDSLERLDLSQTRITDVGLEKLAGLQGVRELNLYFAEFVSEFGLASLKDWKSLERLNLRGTMVRSRIFETLAGLESLRELDLSHTRITDEGFDQLAGLRRLERLSTGSNRLEGHALEILKLLPALRSLDLRGVQRVDSGLWGLALNRRNLERISELKQIEELLLGGATITDVGADRPGREDAERAELLHVELLASLKKLRKLDLSRQPVSVGGLEFLPALLELRDLNLGQCSRIDDLAVSLLAKLPKLETVYLAGTDLTDAGLAALQGLELQRLSVGGSAVTAIAVEQYRAARPETTLTWFPAEAFGQARRAQ